MKGTTQQIIARLNDTKVIKADKDDPAIKYFESVFGKGKRTSGQDGTFVVFDDMVVDKQTSVTSISLQISDGHYALSCRLKTPFIDMQGPDEDGLTIEGASASEVISGFKEDIKLKIKAQQDDIKEDQKNLQFLKKLSK